MLMRPLTSVLKLSPGDEDALRCKVVALVSNGDFEETQKVLGHKRLEGQMQFERVSDVLAGGMQAAEAQHSHTLCGGCGVRRFAVFPQALPLTRKSVSQHPGKQAFSATSTT